MTADELRASGVLMEANRTFFHPLGLELYLGQGMSETMLLVRKRTPVSAVLPGAALSTSAAVTKARAVESCRRRAAATRRRVYGWAVQPIPELDDGVPLDFVWSERALDTLFDIAEEVRHVEGDLLVALTQSIPSVFSQCQLKPGGVVDLRSAEETEAHVPGLTGWETGRLLWLARTLPDFAKANGDQRISGALYPDELAEVEAFAEEVSEWQAKGEIGEGRPKVVLDRLEMLYSLAQPGMRFFRGDPAAQDSWDEIRDRVSGEIKRYLANRPETDRMLQGDLAPSDLDNPEAVADELANRLRGLDEQEARVSTELEAIRRMAQPLRDALTQVQP